MHKIEDVIAIFNDCFAASYNTRLIKGDSEPIYLPADDQRSYHAIYFAHGFFSSALHECAHWLIAGEQRRAVVDFGYWYAPDGRNEEQQNLFQKVEVKPQAMEWILSKAAGHPFRVSIDNLDGVATDPAPFKAAIHNQVLEYCVQGLPLRAQQFRSALCQFYCQPEALRSEDFMLE